MYFIKQTSSWQANNSLKKYLSPILTELSGQQVEDPAEVINFLTGKVAFANHHFKKCTPVVLTSRTMTRFVDQSQYITVGEVGELSLYFIKETFTYAPPVRTGPDVPSPQPVTMAYNLFGE